MYIYIYIYIFFFGYNNTFFGIQNALLDIEKKKKLITLVGSVGALHYVVVWSIRNSSRLSLCRCVFLVLDK